MNAKFLVAVSISLLGGCSTADINRISQDVMNGAANTVLSSAGFGQAPAGGSVAGGVQQPVRSGPGSHSVSRERISLVHAERTSKDYGSIQLVRTEKNPQSRTQLNMESCSHPGLGQVSCNGWIFAVTPEGWLVNDPIIFGGVRNPITLAAGIYYFKLENSNAGAKYYVTGEFRVAPHVSNFVSLQLE